MQYYLKKETMTIYQAKVFGGGSRLISTHNFYKIWFLLRYDHCMNTLCERHAPMYGTIAQYFKHFQITEGLSVMKLW